LFVLLDIFTIQVGGFVVTIPIRLLLYIIYIAPIVSSPQPSLHHTYSDCKRFLISVSYRCVKFTCHTLPP
jgi:hypothetical protein